MRMGWGGKWKHVFSMVVINFGFGLVNLLLKKALDQGLNHLVIVTYRQAISATFLFPIAYFWERKSRSELTPQILCHLFLSALIGITPSQYLFLIGLEFTSATFSCAFLNMVPVITFILSLLFGLEKVNMKSKSGTAKVLGSLLCVCGALLLTIYRGMPLAHSHSSATVVQENHHHMMISAKKTERWIVGSMFLGGGSLLWSSWFLIQARIGKKYPFQYTSTAILSFFSAVQSAILSLAIHRNISMWVLKGTLEIISVIYAGMVASGLCYVGMSWCINHKGPVFTAAFTPFTQIFVAIFDFSVLHEQIYLGSVLGSILVVIGMYILLWGKSKEAKECSVKQNQAAEEGEDGKQVSHVSTVTVNSR
ncbi:WAT1-related protein At3g30340 [Ziziphus jujuba]|uniref:WAT1-related protein n=1 Tax=Ziziphus jujuba TaxID=326968 RepID=A0A6P4A4X2_ZIZJJ|nr:WAT1-related protein At3g30340 [Ziziphus jujuba]